MESREIQFPDGFVWGASTAAYQIEGAWNLEGKGESIWDRFSRTYGRISGGETADTACDHYNRIEEDVMMMKLMGLNSYRFSISWPRVLPKGRGLVNSAGLDFYDRLVDTLLDHDIEPFVTLYHWDLPQALQEFGGWGSRETCYQFADYAALMVRRLGDRVRFWTTINEPWMAAFWGNKTGYHAPGVNDEVVAMQVAHNLLVAHGLAVQAIRGSAPSSRKKPEVGISLSLNPAEPAGTSPEDIAMAEMLWQKEGRWFLDPLLRAQYPEGAWNDYDMRVPQVRPGDLALISQNLDFLGVNYYYRNVVSAQGRLGRNPGSEYTEMGWEVHPLTLYRLLVYLSDEYILPPLYLTENGSAYKDILNDEGQIHDRKRIAYMRDHLHHARLTMDSGVDLRGYFVRSLMDSFEWAHGTSKRFGLAYVDFDTKERILKDSARWYADTIKHNGFNLDEDFSSTVEDEKPLDMTPGDATPAAAATMEMDGTTGRMTRSGEHGAAGGGKHGRSGDFPVAGNRSGRTGENAVLTSSKNLKTGDNPVFNKKNSRTSRTGDNSSFSSTKTGENATRSNKTDENPVVDNTKTGENPTITVTGEHPTASPSTSTTRTGDHSTYNPKNGPTYNLRKSKPGTGNRHKGSSKINDQPTDE